MLNTLPLHVLILSGLRLVRLGSPVLGVPLFIAFQHGLDFGVGQLDHRILVDIFTLGCLAGDLGHIELRFAVCGQLHPHALAEPVFMHMVRRHNDAGPGRLVRRVGMGNLDADALTACPGREGGTDKPPAKLDGDLIPLLRGGRMLQVVFRDNSSFIVYQIGV